ncbi:MAG: formimidoylglutamase [Bacteroidota bacterium]|nr:formimidoylglutamase [Bacteroidota bacterium]
MDISIFFEPLKTIDYENILNNNSKSMGKVIDAYFDEGAFPDLENKHIALIGVKEDRSAVNNEGCALAPDYIRKYFYKLSTGFCSPKIVDLGNIKRGFEVEDTYYAISNVITELLKLKIIPVIIGGSQDLTKANYTAYESLSQVINIVSVDNQFDLGNPEERLNSQSYLSNIIVQQPNFLFNFTNIGYQTYFVEQEYIDLMKKLYFDIYRLGLVRSDLNEVEPMVRNADVMSFDISAIRQSDAPGNCNATPNGFYGEEACQIVRFAGLSDKLTSIGFYEYNPLYDKSEQTAHLLAQMIWYFIDGYYNRKQDFPLTNKSDFIKYLVSISDHKHEIVFFKSKRSERWWMEVPCPADRITKYERHHLIPCSYADYKSACNEDMPDRWWQAYQKLTVNS